MHFKFIMLVTTLIVKYVYSTNLEGEYCFHQALNKDGVCTLISSCPSAMEYIHTRRIFPQLCRPNKYRAPIVCCENNNVTTTPNTPSIEETTTPLIERRIEVTLRREIPQIGDEGDYCFIRALNEVGVCTLLTSCPSAIKLIRTRRIFPQFCGNKMGTPILCCENNNVTTTVGPITTTAPNTPSIEDTTIPLIDRRTEITIPTISKESTIPPFETSISTEIPQIGDKSRQKCHEYANYTYIKFDFVLERFPPPLIAECEIVEIENTVGARPARLMEFPHMALLGFERDGELHWLCSGSLISENYVLSVAHCQFIQNYGAPTYVLLGELTLNSETDGAKPQKIPIERVIPHDEYIPNERYNDIALYKLQHNANLNPYVRPACLNSDSTRDISLSIASGWGNSPVLEKVVLDMYTNDECNYVYRNLTNGNMRRRISEESQICAGSRIESGDACFGEGKSGDPLQIINSNEVFCTHIIVGINSFGRYCGMRDNPGVYTKVSHYIEWIEGIVWE